MLRRIFMLAMTALLLTACAGYPDTRRQRLETLPQHHSQFDLELAWETRIAGGNTVVEGVAQNVRWAFMYDLEIWVAVLDPAGKEAARSVSFVIPRKINLDEIAEFEVKLPIAVAPGTKLRFTYKYRGSEGGFDGLLGARGAVDWMQSFDAVAPGR